MRRMSLLVIALLVACSSSRTFTVQEEDDVLALRGRSDRGYTNGTRLMWTSTPDDNSRSGRLAGILCFDDPLCECSVTYGIGQSMYTPENLRSTRPIVRDRPYGGWLYLMSMFDAVKASSIDHVELYGGVVGPDSHADDVQIFWHKHVTPGSPDPLGWETQIGQWAGFNATYQHRWRWIEKSHDEVRYLDVTPTLGMTLGNVFTYPAAGVTLRIGHNLPLSFLQPIPARVGAAQTSNSGNYDYYFFTTAEARYVAWNVFLDAEDDAYRIRRKPLVRDHRYGAGLRIRRVRIEYTHTRRTAEFSPDPRSHPYGTIRVVIGANP